jgi:Protein of unknown function (DUF2997)
MPREIEVIYNTDGTVTIEALGFEGKSCEEATRELEKVLGDTLEKKRKSEYYKEGKALFKQKF